MVKIASMIIALLASGAAFAEENFSSLEERMSFADFRALGLDQLSPEQLKGLNDWLRAHGTTSCKGTPQPATQRSAGPQETAIAGDFSGWEFGSVLTLENGQRWRVMEHDPYVTARVAHPRVRVEAALLGGWTLAIDGVSQLVHVEPAN